MTRRPFGWGYSQEYSRHDEDTEAAKCLEMLLDAGLKWAPSLSKIKDVRRAPGGR